MNDHLPVKERVTLVERLRFFATQTTVSFPGYLADAADEIERLERELAHTREYPAQCGCEYDDEGDIEAMCLKHWQFAHYAIGEGKAPPAFAKLTHETDEARLRRQLERITKATCIETAQDIARIALGSPPVEPPVATEGLSMPPHAPECPLDPCLCGHDATGKVIGG